MVVTMFRCHSPYVRMVYTIVHGVPEKWPPFIFGITPSKWKFLHFTRYSGDTFQVWWTGSKPLNVEFLQDSVYLKLFISVYFWRSCSKNKKVVTFQDTQYSRRRGIQRSVVSVFPHSERKTSGAIETRLGRPVTHGRTSACTEHEIKRSKVKVKVKLHLYSLHWLLGVKSTSQQILAATGDGLSTCRPSRLALWRHYVIGWQLALPAWERFDCQWF